MWTIITYKFLFVLSLHLFYINIYHINNIKSNYFKNNCKTITT